MLMFAESSSEIITVASVFVEDNCTSLFVLTNVIVTSSFPSTTLSSITNTGIVIAVVFSGIVIVVVIVL